MAVTANGDEPAAFPTVELAAAGRMVAGPCQGDRPFSQRNLREGWCAAPWRGHAAGDDDGAILEGQRPGVGASRHPGPSLRPLATVLASHWSSLIRSNSPSEMITPIRRILEQAECTSAPSRELLERRERQSRRAFADDASVA